MQADTPQHVDDPLFPSQVGLMITTASISFIASLCLSVAIYRSEEPSAPGAGGARSSSSADKSLLASSPYHRIIFGICVCDLLQSFSLTIGPFVTPSDVPQALWGIGSAVSCRAGGFLFIAGHFGTPMYTLMLAYYSLCGVKKRGARTIGDLMVISEKKLHIFIISYNIFVNLLALVTESINTYPKGWFCTVATVPTGCRQEPEIYGECEAIGYVNFLVLITNTLTPFFCMVGVLVCMVQIARHVMQSTKSGEKRPLFSLSSRKSSTLENDARLSSLRGGSDKKTTIVADTNSPPGTQEDQDSRDVTSSAKQDNSEQQVPEPPLREGTSTNAQDLVQGYKKDILIQAYLYMSVLFFQYGANFFPLISNWFFKSKAPDWSHYLIAFFYPLGGFFNILVYTRPKVISFRRKQPELSWFGAFVMVFKAGVAVPMITPREEDELDEVDAEDCEERDGSHPSSRITPSVDLGCRMSSDGVMNNRSESESETKHIYQFYPRAADNARAAGAGITPEKESADLSFDSKSSGSFQITHSHNPVIDTITEEEE
jgi:hypothetical protein